METASLPPTTLSTRTRQVSEKICHLIENEDRKVSPTGDQYA